MCGGASGRIRERDRERPLVPPREPGNVGRWPNWYASGDAVVKGSLRVHWRPIVVGRNRHGEDRHDLELATAVHDSSCSLFSPRPCCSDRWPPMRSARRPSVRCRHARERRHVLGATGASRDRVRQGGRGQETARRRDDGRAQGQGRLRECAGRPRSQDRRSDAGRHHLPDLLDDQTHRVGGRDDPGRGRQATADRSSRQVAARLQGREGVDRRRRGRRAAPHDRAGSAAPHRRPSLRRAHPERGRQGRAGQGRPVQARGDRVRRARHDGRRAGRAARKDSPALSARHDVGIQPRHRRARPGRGSRLRQAARRLPERARVHAAPDDRHRVLGAGRQARRAWPSRSTRTRSPAPRSV